MDWDTIWCRFDYDVLRYVRRTLGLRGVFIYDAAWIENQRRPEVEMASLIKALEGGGYNAAPGTLTQGCSLEVESLEVTMRCVTFESPEKYKRMATRFYRLAKWAAFFHLWGWRQAFDFAGLAADRRAGWLTIQLRR